MAVRVLAACVHFCALGAAKASTIPPPRPNVAAKGKTACQGVESSVAGGSLVTTVRLKVGGRRYQVEIGTAGALGEPRRSSFTVALGHRTLIRGEATGSPDGFTLKVDLDRGVRGVRHLELVSPDAHTVSGTVDGRALAPFAIGGTTAPDFVDGGKVPKLKVKPALRRALRKLATCAGAEPSVTPQALISSCDTCNAGCGLAFTGCGLGVLLSAAAGVGIPTARAEHRQLRGRAVQVRLGVRARQGLLSGPLRRWARDRIGQQRVRGDVLGRRGLLRRCGESERTVLRRLRRRGVPLLRSLVSRRRGSLSQCQYGNVLLRRIQRRRVRGRVGARPRVLLRRKRAGVSGRRPARLLRVECGRAV
jgi:hypothetical protein